VRSRIRPEEALLAIFGVLLVVIMATTGHWTFTNTLHRRFILTFVVLSIMVFGRALWRAPSLSRATVEQALVAGLFVIRDFFPFLLALLFYETLHDLTPLVRHDVVDGTLIAIDRAVFGADVSVWMGHFASAWLTRVMVFCYMSYFFAPAILAALMYWAERRQLFRDFLVSLCVATLIGYTGYILVPAVGPFVFQNELFPERLPGGGLSSTLWIVHAVDALKGSARDCFPSLHTAHTTVVVAFAWRFSRRAFLVYLPIALGLYVSTVYLRMHYVVDVAAGFATAALAVALGPRLERWWYKNETGAAWEDAAPVSTTIVSD
jgi:membrane-associated phospholipid phosphatase